MSFDELLSLGPSGSDGAIFGEATANRPNYSNQSAVACEADNNIARLGLGIGHIMVLPLRDLEQVYLFSTLVTAHSQCCLS